MSNKSSINGKYVGRTFTTKDMQSDEFRKVRYDAMILCKQRKEKLRKRKAERQNKRKAR